MKITKNHELAHMSWFIPVFLFFCWEPLGILLGILKIIDTRAERREQQEQQDSLNRLNGMYNGQAASARTAFQAGTPQYRSGSQTAAGNPTGWQSGSAQTYRAPAQGQGQYPAAGQTGTYFAQNALEQQKSLKRHHILTIVLGVLAAVALLSGIPTLLTGIEWTLYGMFDSFTLFDYLLPGFVQILGGLGLGFCSARMARNLKREKLLVTIVGARDHISVQELSTASGYSEKKIVELLKDAVGHGLFGPAAYIDMGTRTLIVRGTAPAKPAPQPARAPKAPAKPAEENPYQATLRELRELNDAIPGEEMSAKISQLENISARIFDLAERDPKKKPMLNRFMDYYLPTAKKLLKTYATLDSQGVAGTNISETKATIENSMDLLVKAFEAQLDKLFQADALDISGDVAALQGMMSMDGLTGTDFVAPQKTPFSQE